MIAAAFRATVAHLGPRASHLTLRGRTVDALPVEAALRESDRSEAGRSRDERASAVSVLRDDLGFDPVADELARLDGWRCRVVSVADNRGVIALELASPRS